MREFAEQEVIVPDGPYAGRRFRCSRQPFTGLWFDEVDSQNWSRLVATGPTQSGKTLACFVVPLLYHLFELSETVICGLPDMDMAADKWNLDILPIIQTSQYRSLLPRRGGGSRGGRVESIQFTNGATLKFMSGGGSDKSRAGFTSRVVVITETDGMDQPGISSRESDKITQLEARTRAYGSRKRIYMECTVSTEDGRTWREYKNGTRSCIVSPCPACHDWVAPEREHLLGWQDAANQHDARASGAFTCPSCGERWTEDSRRQANSAAQLLHVGQTVDAVGRRTGNLPATDTLGFRWSAFNNLFLPAGDLAADEFRARRSADEENAEREMRQFVWCIPVMPTKWDETSLESDDLVKRQAAWPRGLVPPGCLQLTAAVDLGKYLAHWILVAWSKDAVGHVVDYARIEIPSDDLGVEQAIIVGLREFRDQVNAGWPVAEGDGEVRRPDQVWIDAGYMPDAVYAFCRDSGMPFRPAIGRGASQQRMQAYHRPQRTGSTIRHIGQGFHINYLRSSRIQLVEVDADHWKTWSHTRLATPLDQPGSMTFYKAPPTQHLTLAKHLTAETKQEEYIAGRGVVTRWERRRRQNHWLDALYNACAAGFYAGVRLVGEADNRRPNTNWFAQQQQQN